MKKNNKELIAELYRQINEYTDKYFTEEIVGYKDVFDIDEKKLIINIHIEYTLMKDDHYMKDDIQYIRCINPGLNSIDIEYDYSNHSLRDFINTNKEEILCKLNEQGFRSLSPFYWIEKDMCMADFIELHDKEVEEENNKKIK